MHKIFLLVVFTLAGIMPGYAQIKPLESKIEKVIVFLKGAQLTRTAQTTIPAGTSEWIFKGLAENVDVNSLQVGVDHGVTLLSVRHNKNFMEVNSGKGKIEEFENKLLNLKDRMEELNQWLNVYNEEQKLLIANRNMGGKQGGVQVAELVKAADFYRNRLADINAKRLEIKKKQRTLTQEINRLNKQVDEWINSSKSATSEVIVKLSCLKPIRAKLHLSYFLRDAGWTPCYDVRVKDIQHPLLLNYKALVHQNTGVDWNDVKMILSSANPNLGGVKPELKRWVVGYTPAPRPAPKVASRMQIVECDEELDDQLEIEDVDNDEDGALKSIEGKVAGLAKRKSSLRNRTRGPVVRVSGKALRVEFAIDKPFSISSGEGDFQVNVQAFEIPANYQYFCTPKLDLDAFLVAQIGSWEEYKLMKGKMNLYFEGTYVGTSIVDPQSISDTLNLSLGRDKNVVVTREKLKEKNGKQFLGSFRKEMRAWEISVRNKKSQPIQITIEDQYPISRYKDITVEHISHDGAKLDESSGKLEWDLNVPSRETQRVDFSYSLKYPKNMVIHLD